MSLWYLSCRSLSSSNILSFSLTNAILWSSCYLKRVLRFSNSSVTSLSFASKDLLLSWSAFLRCSFYFFNCVISSNKFLNATSCSFSMLSIFVLWPDRFACSSEFSSCTTSYSLCNLVISMLACYSNCMKFSRSCMNLRLSLESPYSSR